MSFPGISSKRDQGCRHKHTGMLNSSHFAGLCILLTNKQTSGLQNNCPTVHDNRRYAGQLVVSLPVSAIEDHQSETYQNMHTVHGLHIHYIYIPTYIYIYIRIHTYVYIYVNMFYYY